ncbi:hypothetical protein K439DRAFT_1617320 [Ramaria rubella]|nr:hypothetical protein K439DRAFT_1617320 [Ramaria rubella]
MAEIVATEQWGAALWLQWLQPPAAALTSSLLTGPSPRVVLLYVIHVHVDDIEPLVAALAVSQPTLPLGAPNDALWPQRLLDSAASVATSEPLAASTALRVVLLYVIHNVDDIEPLVAALAVSANADPWCTNMAIDMATAGFGSCCGHWQNHSQCRRLRVVVVYAILMGGIDQLRLQLQNEPKAQAEARAVGKPLLWLSQSFSLAPA